MVSGGQVTDIGAVLHVIGRGVGGGVAGPGKGSGGVSNGVAEFGILGTPGEDHGSCPRVRDDASWIHAGILSRRQLGSACGRIPPIPQLIRGVPVTPNRLRVLGEKSVISRIVVRVI